MQRSSAILASALRASTTPARAVAQRSFSTSGVRSAPVVAVTPPRKPIGAFRGSVFGFLIGTVLAGSGLYYYVVDEYKISNRLLVEDIYALQSAVSRLEGHIKSLEEAIPKRK